MFVCKECGLEYDIKPDYCECGNDTFDEIIPKPQTEEKKEPSQKISEPARKIKTKSNRYDSFYYEKIKNFFDPVSTIFFLFCIVLSFVIIFFVGNPKEEITPPQHKTTTVNKGNLNIPSIDKIWDNTPPVIKEEVKKQTDIQPVKPVEQIKPVQNIKKIITQPKKEIAKKTETKPVKKVVEQKPKTTNTTPQKTVTPTTKPQVTKTAPTQPQVNKQELANYKIKLRNCIASKIDFASIVGDGTCSVSFNVTSSGQLTNKKFVQQSQNFSLNDMVYNALLKTSYYNPPPSSYNGGTFRMTVKMYDGNFEVSLN